MKYSRTVFPRGFTYHGLYNQYRLKQTTDAWFSSNSLIDSYQCAKAPHPWESHKNRLWKSIRWATYHTNTYTKLCNVQKMFFSRKINHIETLLYGCGYTVGLFTYLCIYQINVSRHKQFLFSGGSVWPPLQLFLSAVSTHKAKQWTFKHIQSSQWHLTLNSRSWGHRLLKEKVQLVLTRTITGLKKKIYITDWLWHWNTVTPLRNETCES